MAQQPRGRHEYQVGWISAIQTEYVVACELLDEEYSSPPAGLPNDNNVYTFGRIGEHHIVLACLPKGKYGLTSATSVAKDMFRSFPSLRKSFSESSLRSRLGCHQPCKAKARLQTSL
jgi:hypothetical protein